METSIKAMQTALRVLTAITEFRNPSPEDMDLLRQFAGPLLADESPDELACAVIQQALKRRAQARKTHGAR